MTTTKKKGQEPDFLDELGALRERIAKNIDVYPDVVKHALSNVDGALAHLESARWQARALERP